MSALETLIAARALIADKKNWTTDVAARGKNKEWVCCKDPAAVRFCADGACLRVASSEEQAMKAMDALNYSAYDMYGSGIAFVNDKIGHHAVLRVFDHTINKLAAGVS